MSVFHASRSRSAVVLAAAAVAVGVAAVPAYAASATLRPADLNTSETRSTGHVEFLRNGLHVWTEGSSNTGPNGTGGTWNTDKAAGYFALSGGIPTSASMAWVGSESEPGKQLVFDADGITGNGNDYNILVGESVYGSVWWLTNSSSATAKTADPSGANNGGSGSEWFGTLAEWQAALPQARALAGGFSLGSGVKGDGVIERMQYGTTVYEFTNLPVTEDGQDGATGATGPVGPAGAAGATAPAKVVDAEGFVSFVKVTRGVKVTLRTDPGAAGEVVGKKVRWIVKVDNKKTADLTQGLGDKDVVAARFATGSGKHLVTIKKNGVVVRTIKVRA